MTATSPRFRADVVSIPDAVRKDMAGRSWHDAPDCPRFSDLRLVRLTHWGVDGAVHDGELVVAARIAGEAVDAFGSLFEARFPIERMERIDAFDGDDARSMAANNTSCFNFRRILGSQRLSHHALGLAIDINPRWNPMILDGVVHPAAALEYVDRANVRPGMIVRPGPVVAIFESLGWSWGGDWDVPDYHHFSKLPRGE